MASQDFPDGYMIEEAIPEFHYWVERHGEMVLILLGRVGIFTNGEYRAWVASHADGVFLPSESVLIKPKTFLWCAEDLDGGLIPAPPVNQLGNSKPRIDIDIDPDTGELCSLADLTKVNRRQWGPAEIEADTRWIAELLGERAYGDDR